MNVWYCKADHEPIAVVTESDGPVECKCKKTMTKIGWFETDAKTQDG